MRTLLRNYLIDAILLILAGIFLILRPTSTLVFYFQALGVILVVLGAVKVLQYFLEKDRVLRNPVALTIGILQLAAGIFLFLNPAFLIGFFPFAAGIVIAYGAILGLIQSIRARQMGIPASGLAIGCSLVTLVLAIVVILHPEAISAILIQFIGVSLIAEGLSIMIALSR